MRVFTWAVSVLTASLLLAGGVPAVSSAAPEVQAVDADQGSGFTAVAPRRLMDTSAGPGGTAQLDLTGAVPASATAVVLNVTGVQASAKTFVTLYPNGADLPLTSNFIFDPNDTKAGSTTVAIGADRKVSLYNYYGAVRLIVDLNGYYEPGTGSRFTPQGPSRMFRSEGNFVVGPGGTITVDFTTYVPASATAVVFNLTGVDVAAPTHVTAWAGGSVPDTSNLNLMPGRATSNFVTAALGADRKVRLFSSQGSVRLLIDFAGFYTPDYGAVFTPVAPRRILDTRDGTGSSYGQTSIGPAMTIGVKTTGVDWLMPAEAIAVVVNLTATQATEGTYLTAWQNTNSRVPTSNVNVVPGQDVANLAVVELRGDNPESRFTVYNSAGRVHVIGDLTGYFWVPPAQCTANCVYIWGRPTGHGTTRYSPFQPMRQPGLSNVRAVSASYALRADGTVVAWGWNQNGQLGNGWYGSQGSTVPVPVIGLTAVVAIAAGDQNGYAVRSDGTVWAWGGSANGLLGDGAPNNAVVPRQVPALTAVKSIAVGRTTAYAVHQDGTVSAWGRNEYGQLGTGSTADRANTPVKIPGLAGVTAIAGDGATAYALKSDQTLWSWGRNGFGELGTGSTEPLSRVPAQVANLTGVTAVSGDDVHGMAVTSDGSAWAWGRADYGGLGIGVDCVDCSTVTPLKVAGLVGVTGISASGSGGYALRSDGSVWAWGNNYSGQLGDGGGDRIAFSPARVENLPPASVVNGEYGARVIVANA